VIKMNKLLQYDVKKLKRDFFKIIYMILLLALLFVLQSK